MNLAKILGVYQYNDGFLLNASKEFQLFIAPSKTKNPASPPYQLLFRQHGHPNDNRRLTGLFKQGSSNNIFRGDIYLHGKRETFILKIDRVKSTAKIYPR